jgi:biotin transport system substrate-specific component
MRWSVKEMVLVSLFAVLTAVGALVRVPVGPVPMTFQLLFVLAAGVVLGPRLGPLSQAVYLAMGLVGIPVFANGGGPQYVIEPTFGYMLGFVAAAWLAGAITGALWKRPGFPKHAATVLACLAGTLAVYVLGIAYLYLIRNVRFGAGITVFQAVVMGTSALVWKDIVLCFVVAALPMRLLRAAGRSPQS